MMKKISFILLGTLLGACSNSAPTLLGDWQLALLGDWQLAGINSNGKVIPLNPCSKQNYFSFQYATLFSIEKVAKKMFFPYLTQPLRIA